MDIKEKENFKVGLSEDLINQFMPSTDRGEGGDWLIISLHNASHVNTSHSSVLPVLSLPSNFTFEEFIKVLNNAN